VREEISGVPLGLSRDYDQLPLTEPLHIVRCQICDGLYEDAMRLMADGCRVLAVMCAGCRAQGRTRWISAQRIELPAAIARYRS
jgi:hypothetical protein